MIGTDVEFLLKELGCSKIRNAGGVVYASCPLARWTHRKSRDEHPSFTVMVDDAGISGAKCHACGFSGSLLELVFKAKEHAGSPSTKAQMNELADFVRGHNGPSFGLRMKARRERKTKQEERELSMTPEERAAPPFDWNREVAGIKGVQVDWITKLEGKDDLPILPEDALSKFEPCTGKVLDWLTGEGKGEYGERRNLTLEMIKQWEICWDPKFKSVIFPIRDCKGRLVSHSARGLDLNRKGPKYMHSKGFKRDFYVYGEHLWKPGGTGVITEGFFDVMRLNAFGYKAGAAMGTALSEFQIEKLIRYCDIVVIATDGDAAGYEAAPRWYKQLSERLPTRIAKIPEDYSPGDFSFDQARFVLGDPA